MKRKAAALLLALVLLVQLLPGVRAAEARGLDLTNPADLAQKITYIYKKALYGAEARSFDGYCARYVNWQLYLLGINKEWVGGNGNDEFGNYRYLSKSNGGYSIKAYSASRYSLKSALNAICENGTKDVYNVLVGFKSTVTAAGQKYGHTLFIHAILDGNVYYSDSFKTKVDEVEYPEGTPIACSIDSFCAYYNKFATLDGLIHFTRDASDHSCTMGTKFFTSAVHPHYDCYQCQTCGRVWLNNEGVGYSAGCYDCIQPEKPVLVVEPGTVVRETQTVRFVWEPTERTTHYNLYIRTLNDAGREEKYETIFYAESGLERQLPMGRYQVLLQSNNANATTPEGSGYAYTNAEIVELAVYDTWPCALIGHDWELETREATCEEDGYTRGVCRECGETMEEITEAIGHAFSRIGTEAPTLEEPGAIVYGCVNCGLEERMAIPTLGELPFPDIEVEDYYFFPALWAWNRGVISGTGDGAFSPHIGASRAQVMTMLWRLAGAPEAEGENAFTDVAPTAYYAKAVQWACTNGITFGTTETTFDPNQIVTRAEFVTFLYRLAGRPQVESTILFTDVRETAYYAAPIQWAAQNGITSGVGENRFGPKETCTRAQAVSFLYRFAD